MSVPAPTTAYCTILATNYLPKALSLATSLRRHHPDAELVVVLIDAREDGDLPKVDLPPGVRLASTAILNLPERELLQLATIYDLVEFATSIKPVLFTELLRDSDQVAYLDPDTYLTAPMEELSPSLQASEGGILLTPHYLEPVPSGLELGESHLLSVGVYNLGFCAFDRRALPFLEWWWGHLQTECLCEPLSGLFVDQKWVDIGAVTFRAKSWEHPGYNVSVANLHERPVSLVDGAYRVGSEPLRLFHFHAFDPDRPEELSTRLNESTAHLLAGNDALKQLCVEYGELVRHHRDRLPAAPAYTYSTDTAGKPVRRRHRRAYRVESLAGKQLPSPYVPAEAAAYARWLRHARTVFAREVASDAAKSARLAMPEEYDRFKKKMPAVVRFVRGRMGDQSGIWG